MQVSALTNLNAGRGAAYILRKVFQTNPMAQANQVMIARSFSFKDGSDRAFLCRSYQDSDDVTGTQRPWVESTMAWKANCLWLGSAFWTLGRGSYDCTITTTESLSGMDMHYILRKDNALLSLLLFDDG